MSKKPYKILRSDEYATIIINGDCNIPMGRLEEDHLWGYKRLEPFPYKVLMNSPSKTIILRYVKV